MIICVLTVQLQVLVTVHLQVFSLSSVSCITLIVACKPRMARASNFSSREPV